MGDTLSLNPPGRNRKRLILGAVGSFLFIASILLVYWVAYRRSNDRLFLGLNNLEKYMEQNGGWAVPKPPREDWLPGTILLLENGVTTTFLNHQSLYPPEVKRYSGDSPLPDFRVTLGTSEAGTAKFLGGKQTAALSSAGISVVYVTSTNTETRYIERPTLESALKKSDAIREALSNANWRLFLITESLIAKDFRYSQEQGLNVEAEAKARIAVEGTFTGNTKGQSSTQFSLVRPVVVGVHAAEITRRALNLGAPDELIIRDLSPTDLKSLSDSIALSPKRSNLRLACHLHTLSVGLDLYAAPKSGPIGGWVEGAPESAQLVASWFHSIACSDRDSSVTLYAPSLSKGTIRPRVTAPGLKLLITDWFADRVAAITRRRSRLPDSKTGDVFVVYFCGHGITTSATGTTFILPEDYASRPPDHRPSADTALPFVHLSGGPRSLSAPVVLLADCCRAEDQQQRLLMNPGLIFGEAARSLDRFNRTMLSLNPPWETMLFGSALDSPATMVSCQIDGLKALYGPLAVNLDLVFKELEAGDDSVTLIQFVDRLRREKLIGTVSLRGYFDRSLDDLSRTKWQDDTEVPFAGKFWTEENRKLYEGTTLLIRSNLSDDLIVTGGL